MLHVCLSVCLAGCLCRHVGMSICRYAVYVGIILDWWSDPGLLALSWTRNFRSCPGRLVLSCSHGMHGGLFIRLIDCCWSLHTHECTQLSSSPYGSSLSLPVAVSAQCYNALPFAVSAQIPLDAFITHDFVAFRARRPRGPTRILRPRVCQQ